MKGEYYKTNAEVPLKNTDAPAKKIEDISKTENKPKKEKSKEGKKGFSR